MLSTELEGKIAAIVGPALAGLGYDLVRVVVLGRERPTVQIMADRGDGSAITIEDCETISHALNPLLDVEDPIPGAWTLEISSAGIDRPLTRPKDWNRYAGHLARVEVAVPVGGQRRFAGIIVGANDQVARVRLEDDTEVALPHADMRRARLVLTDELIAANTPRKPTN